MPWNVHPEIKWPWKLLGQDLPIVKSTPHISIQHDFTSGGLHSSLKNNLQKACGALYAMMGAGLHGKSVLNSVTVKHLWTVYVMPEVHSLTGTVSD